MRFVFNFRLDASHSLQSLLERWTIKTETENALLANFLLECPTYDMVLPFKG